MASTPSKGPKSPALQSNLDVDYVLKYNHAELDKNNSTEKLEKLLYALASIGLATEVRVGDKKSLLIFIKVASQDHLYGEVYRSRVEDWIHGIRSAEPSKETKDLLESEPLREAEKQRILYQLITNSESEGGAGITPGEGNWQCVECLCPLHDHAYNKQWIKKWSTSYLLSREDLDDIRNRFGEKIAFYFAFTQDYFTFLLFPAAFGFSSWILLGYYSTIYALVNGLWSVVFVEWWKRQELDLAVRWGVQNVSKIDRRRKNFVPESVEVDSVTGGKTPLFPVQRRLQRQLLQIPFAFLAVLMLGTLYATSFAIEIFISEIYGGPGQRVLVFIPTIILVTMRPVLANTLTKLATKLTEFENYETQGAHDAALIQKTFVINFITSYLPIFLTAFVYLPFAQLLVPYLDVFSLTVKPLANDEKQTRAPASGFQINADRLRNQVFFFTVTAQVTNFAIEVVVPYLKRKGLSKYKEMQNEREGKENEKAVDTAHYDHPEEATFLTRVRKEMELEYYDVTDDLQEMVLQFGYLSLFSVVWPLTGISFLINNWIELRADAVKICIEMRRPVPQRAQSIGTWLDNLSFLTWVGSISSAAIVYLFSNDGRGPDGSPRSIQGWALLLTIFFSEHIFLGVRWVVSTSIAKLDSPGKQKERRERYMVRRKYFNDSLSQQKQAPTLSDAGEYQGFSRISLEEEARQSSTTGSSLQDRFWSRQRNWRESSQVGAQLIEKVSSSQVQESKKAQ